jgi:hypothetical protein
MPPAYHRTVPLAVAREEAFAAIATLDGLRGWWTAIVTGSPEPGGELRFRHDRIPPDLVAPGWERFLASLETLVERGEGMPYGHAAAS